MASLNQCSFIGRVGKTPEIRYAASGIAIANLSIACSEKFKNKAGEYEEKTEWVNVSMFGKLAEITGEFVDKGKEIFVSGRLQTRKWQDKEGNDRYTTEIVADKMLMLGGKGEGKPAQQQERRESTYQEQYDDDSIPF